MKILGPLAVAAGLAVTGSGLMAATTAPPPKVIQPSPNASVQPSTTQPPITLPPNVTISVGTPTATLGQAFHRKDVEVRLNELPRGQEFASILHLPVGTWSVSAHFEAALEDVYTSDVIHKASGRCTLSSAAGEPVPGALDTAVFETPHTVFRAGESSIEGPALKLRQHVSMSALSVTSAKWPDVALVCCGHASLVAGSPH